MLRCFKRYPIVIVDPSGQATKFIMNDYNDRKITKTSFLDDDFREKLKKALISGNPLLVQHAEHYDPVLNPILNREQRRTDRGVLVTLDDEDINVPPSFVIFFSILDPSVEFPSEVFSRLSFVNFTVTRPSLRRQCLSVLLKTVRPNSETPSSLLQQQGVFFLNNFFLYK